MGTDAATCFVIIENEAGLTVADVAEGETSEDAAVRHGGVVVDPGPFATYEEAYEALIALPDEDDSE